MSHDPRIVGARRCGMSPEQKRRAFQDTIHASPNVADWYGWGEMRRDVTDVQAMAEELRRAHGKR
jgi:hydroxylamine dehydrogenase